MTAQTHAACFPADIRLPDHRAAVAAVDHGQGGREIMDAVFRGDHLEVERLAGRDPALLRASDGRGCDLLVAAMSRCDLPMLDLLLALGAPPDGPKGPHDRYDGDDPADQAPLILALHATTPDFAERLLQAGASSNALRPQAHHPLEEAVVLGSPGAVRLLLDHGAAPGAADEVGSTPLLSAVELGLFQIAEALLQHGADPFAADSAGGTPANVISDAPVRGPAEAEARTRVIARLQRLGAWPATDAREVRVQVMAGAWPPAHAHAAAPAPQVVALMRRNWKADGSTRPG